MVSFSFSLKFFFLACMTAEALSLAIPSAEVVTSRELCNGALKKRQDPALVELQSRARGRSPRRPNTPEGGPVAGSSTGPGTANFNQQLNNRLQTVANNGRRPQGRRPRPHARPGTPVGGVTSGGPNMANFGAQLNVTQEDGSAGGLGGLIVDMGVLAHDQVQIEGQEEIDNRVEVEVEEMVVVMVDADLKEETAGAMAAVLKLSYEYAQAQQNVSTRQ
ncbi:hypothetical protein FA15DRAFT_757826 [Coprinopsis marcescibilis]|uniref:Uncharacterized protein n=1 Tax=Coprinopsis marcescibilis TaxID=230819 RepID=A0A5C3KR75_COPMA|nr:hypothetical protein FA15DRAFT_757826 [Coprinopsis marcescibilis]